MDYAAVELTVKEVLADKLNKNINDITPGMLLLEDLGMDSFGSIETIFELEEKFNLKIPDSDLEKVKTVKDIVDYVSSKTQGTA
jgi:acyl carrier protein